jgi:hypothetical protein
MLKEKDEFELGDEVQIKGTNTKGTIIDKNKTDKQGEYTVLKEETPNDTKKFYVAKFDSKELLLIIGSIIVFALICIAKFII